MLHASTADDPAAPLGLFNKKLALVRVQFQTFGRTNLQHFGQSSQQTGRCLMISQQVIKPGQQTLVQLARKHGLNRRLAVRHTVTTTLHDPGGCIHTRIGQK